MRVERTSERWFAAEILRLQAEVLEILDRLQDAKACLARALETAAHQQARFWELRAALSAARLGLDGAAARERVRRLQASFSEGFELPDLQAAQALTGGFSLGAPARSRGPWRDDGIDRKA
jgi:hypothetical protein